MGRLRAGQPRARCGRGWRQRGTRAPTVPPGRTGKDHACVLGGKGRDVFHRYFPHSTFLRMVTQAELRIFFVITVLVKLKKCTTLVMKSMK